jgi:hypothetical protein
MSETIAKNARIGLVVLAGAVVALLLVLIVEMASPRPASAEIIGTSAQVDVPENGIKISDTYRSPWVDTGKTIQLGQSVEIKADPFYTIWSGVWFTGRNGPSGWDRCDSDRKFPLTNYMVSTNTGTCSRPYSLIGRLNGRYFYVGEYKDLKYDWGSTGARLYLRINDDVINNGNGYFKAGITVYQGNKCVRVSPDQVHCPI